jgi:hypothetical protein
LERHWPRRIPLKLLVDILGHEQTRAHCSIPQKPLESVRWHSLRTDRVAYPSWMKKFLQSIAWKAHVEGQKAAEFEAAAHRHGSAFWFYVIATAVVWWFADWRWALIPEALAVWTAWNASSANIVAHYIKKLENAIQPHTNLPQQNAQTSPVKTTAAMPRKSWEQIAREHPEVWYAHEQASYILERQHPNWTLQQLRESYPHILFRSYPKDASEWALWQTLADDPSVPEATRKEYRVQLEIRDMIARKQKASKAESVIADTPNLSRIP